MEWVEIISNYGYALVGYLGLGWGLVKVYEDLKQERLKKDEQVKELSMSVRDLADAVHNNTIAVLSLKEKGDEK